MDRVITEGEEDAIMNFGVFGYDVPLMASVLGWPLADVERSFKNKKSKFNELLQRGQDMGMYAMDRKLWDMSLSGDTKAFDKLENRRAARNQQRGKSNNGLTDEVAKKIYRKYVSTLKKSGNWKDEYEEQVISAASNYSLLQRAMDALNNEEAVIMHSNGTHGQNPWVKIKGDCMKELMAFGRLFGFNPLYENKVSNKNADDESEI
jgi:P27 family predicted phage terminase small subunit